MKDNLTGKSTIEWRASGLCSIDGSLKFETLVFWPVEVETSDTKEKLTTLMEELQ